MVDEMLMKKIVSKNKKIKILLTIVILVVIIATALFQYNRINKLIITKLKSNNKQFNSINSESLESTLREKEISLSVKKFGAVGDGSSHPLSQKYSTLAEAQIDFPSANALTDEIDTVAIQKAITYSCNNGYPMIKIPHGTYKITARLITPQDFNQPIIVGDNPKTTIFDYSTIASGLSCLKFKGGSGEFAKNYISNITFNGNSNSIGLELADVCGMKIINCKFGLNNTGILYHNESTGGFTEFNIAESCDFTSNCSKAIEYKVTKGNNSFHGSGLKQCMINQSATETNPKILIGPNSFPYNSPLDFQCWINNSIPLVRNEGYKICSFDGNITAECLGSSYTVELTDSAYNPIYVLGGMMSLNEKLKDGKTVFCDRIQQNSDGSITIFRKPYNKQIPLTTGSNETISVDNGVVSMVNLIVCADNYEYSYTLSVYRNTEDNNGTVSILSTNRTFNSAGYGEPTFSVSNGKLTITNANYPRSGVTAYFGVSEIGSRIQYVLS